MNETKSYNASIQAVPMPDRIKRLAVSPRGFPVPWFVATIDGVPDFRVIERGRIELAVRRKLCWVCGEQLGRVVAMTLGPMCSITRVISEPPSHRECSIYAARACPFLANPRMRRNEANMPAESIDAPGNQLSRNPGAVAVWLTHGYRPFKEGEGVLFRFDDPIEVLWFAEGRGATRKEVEASIAGGMPLLREEALRQGAEGLAELQRQLARAMRYLPRATSARAATLSATILATSGSATASGVICLTTTAR